MLPPIPTLFAFPLFAIALFAMLPKRHAIVWTMLLGYLFLPPQIGYNLPMLPRLNKETVPPLSVLLCLALFASKPLSGLPVQSGLLPKNRLALTLVSVLILSGFLTSLTNTDRQIFGPTVLPGLGIYSGFSAAQGAIMMVLPMLIARKYLADDANHKLLLKILGLAAVIYSLPVVFEIVMSPQLNKIVYGYFPHRWKQHIRGDGFRPVVFLKHGIWLGVFMCCALLAILAYMRSSEPKERLPYLLLGGWLFLVLLACKVIGATMIAVVLLPVALLLKARLQLLIAAAIASMLLVYPVLRVTDSVPVWQFADLVERYDPSRAGSFRYRLFNEDAMLERASERPLFGWGGFSRARVYNEEGQDTSTIDGFWILQISERGWVGYIALIGLLSAPVILLTLRKRVSLASAGLCLALAANLVALIPYAAITPVTWLFAGALIGSLERKEPEDESNDESATPEPTGPPGYTRFGQPNGRITTATPALSSTRYKTLNKKHAHAS